MKKSKKALLWTIVPVLGVSSGVAGAVAGVTNQKTSVDTNNVATSSTATTMNARSTSKLEISTQTREVLTYSTLVPSVTMSVHVTKESQSAFLKYIWEVNRNDGRGWITHTSTDKPAMIVDVPKNVTKMQNWTFRCTVRNTKSGVQVTSEDIKFTIAPKEGRWIDIVTQPIATTTVNAGEKVTLSTFAKGISRYENKTIGYQWFEYDSSKDKFTEINGATESSYTFTASSNTSTTTTKYVCRYYIKDTNQTKTYLSESNQSIVIVNKDAEEQFKVKPLEASKTEAKVGDKIILSVDAESTKTKKEDLRYQWLKAKGNEYERISDVDSSSTFEYEVTQDDLDKELLFSVLVFGSTQNGKQNHFQGGNVKVTVSSLDGTSGATTNQTFTNTISVNSSVTTNQASVRSTFYPIGGLVRTPEYKVEAKGETGLTYKWYYVSANGAKNLIKNANDSTLKTNKSLFEAAYRDNDKHKVGIVCEIYKGNDLVKTVDQSVNSSFYMTVVITRK